MQKLLLLLSLSVASSTALAGLMCPPKNPGCGIHKSVEAKALDGRTAQQGQVVKSR